MTKNARHHRIGGTENGKQQKCVEKLLYHWSMLMQSYKGHGMQQLWSTKESPRDWQLLIERANLQQCSKCHSVARFVVHSSCSKQSRWRILCWVSALQQNCRCITHVFFFLGGWPLLFYEQNHDMGGMDEYPLTLDPDSAPPKLTNEIILHYKCNMFFLSMTLMMKFDHMSILDTFCHFDINICETKRLVLIGFRWHASPKVNRNICRIWPGTNPSPWAGHHAYSSPRVCVSEIGACMLPRWVEKGHISSQLS